MLSSVRQFVDYLDQKGLKYTNSGRIEGKETEVVDVRFSGENMNTIEARFFFDGDAESVAIRVFDIVKVPAEKVDVMYSVLNAINKRFRFAKFVLDTNDNTVQAEMDAAFRANDVGEICYELLIRMIDICESAYPELMRGLWAQPVSRAGRSYT